MSVTAGGSLFYSPHKMNKDLKSLRQLAVPLLFLALCVAVQQSDSAVSAFFCCLLSSCGTNLKTLYRILPPPLHVKEPRDPRSHFIQRRDATGSPQQAQLKGLERSSNKCCGSDNQNPRTVSLLLHTFKHVRNFYGTFYFILAPSRSSAL